MELSVGFGHVAEREYQLSISREHDQGKAIEFIKGEHYSLASMLHDVKEVKPIVLLLPSLGVFVGSNVAHRPRDIDTADYVHRSSSGCGMDGHINFNANVNIFSAVFHILAGGDLNFNLILESTVFGAFFIVTAPVSVVNGFDHIFVCVVFIIIKSWTQH